MANNSTPIGFKDSLTYEITLPFLNNHYSFVIRFLSIYALGLIVVGTVGNLLTIIALLRRNLRRFVSVRYLIVVSICDTITLYGWNFNNFYKFNISSRMGNIEDLSLIHCRLISYMTFVGLQLSSWCLTAVGLDRALSLYWMHWKQSFGRIVYTKYYIIFLTLVCLTLNGHILFLNGYRAPNGNIICYSTHSRADYIYPQWQRVHLVVYNLCPFALMCICNTYIIFVTVRSSRTPTESTSVQMQRKSIERYRQFTVLLIIVTFAFVILTLPACVYFVFFRKDFVSKWDRDYRFMIQILLNSIQFTSHAINFFLYCFSAKSFRHELHEMFRELLSKCRCICQWSLRRRSIKQKGHIKRYDNGVVLEQRRIYYDRQMQMKQDKLNYTLKFRLPYDKQPGWV